MTLLIGAALSVCPIGDVFAAPGSGAADGGRWIAVGAGVVRDTRSKQEWQQSDNGEDIDWNAARAWCAGKSERWRLPTLTEVKSIYDSTAAGVACAQAVCRVPAVFHLSGTWFWSATQVGRDASDGDELAWGLSVTNGAATEAVREASYGSRVLCVRDR